MAICGMQLVWRFEHPISVESVDLPENSSHEVRGNLHSNIRNASGGEQYFQSVPDRSVKALSKRPRQWMMFGTVVLVIHGHLTKYIGEDAWLPNI